jgi:uncharacterized protein (TIGR03437 family)
MKSLRSSSSAIFAAILLVIIVIIVIKPWQAAGQGGGVTVTTVSAASFDPVAPIAPGSIVAAFGADLAKDPPESAKMQPLPTSLAGTTVKVKDSANMERLAPLFFVSSGQVNYIIPPETATGAAMVTVTNRDGKVSTGAAQIAGAAPGIFSANSTGKGVPAATALRIKSDGSQAFELISRYDAEAKIFVPIPIEPPKTGESVFLILFITGMGNAASAVKVLFGVESLTPAYAGPAPGLAGLDQINIEIPGSLFGRGRVNLTVVAGGLASNTVEIETGCQPGNAPPRVTGPGQSVLVGEQMTITGSGFDTNAANNLVRIRGVEAKMLSATAERLTVRVPYGVESGPLRVCTPQGEGRGANNVSVRTSVSGFVEDTRRQPLADIAVSLRTVAGGTIEDKTSAEGSFVLKDAPKSPQQIIVFADTKMPSSYPTVPLALPVTDKRDNTFPHPVWLQRNTGPSLVVGASSQSNSTGVLAAAAPVQQPGGGVVQTEGFIFEVAGGTRATFPDGSTSGRLTLTEVEDSRTPVALPPAFFSSSVVQIAPFDVRLSPGAKLTFPNRDNLPPGSQARLFRLDQDPKSPRIGSFIEVGVATVSADGKTIATASNAITDTSIYFVAARRSTTTVTGRVVDVDKEGRKIPVQLARVRSRGQETFTDGAGGFVLGNLVANESDFLTVDASFQRASGRVDRAETVRGIRPIVGGITIVGDLQLSPDGGNRPPTILAPATFDININEKTELPIVVSDPDPDQTVTAAVSGANFTMLTRSGNNLYLLKLMPMAGDAGNNTLTITAQDNEGASRSHGIKLKVNRLPVANRPDVVTLDEDTSRDITLTGSDLDGDPLIFIIVQNPASGRLSGSAPNLTYTPNPNYFGPDGFTFKVFDGVGESAPERITIAVRPVNDKPTLSVPGPQVINEGKELILTVTAADVDVNDRLSFSATGLPAGANFDSISAQFRWTPSFDGQTRTETVTFTVNDNSAMPMTCCDSKTVTITVNDVNRPPELTVPGPQMVNSGRNLNFSIRATDPDAGQTLSFSVTDMTKLPMGAIFNDINRQFSWTPGFLQNGVHTVSFTVRDNGTPPLSVTKSVTINVTGEWKKAGPIEGGPVRALLVKDANIFAGTDGGGVFRSSNQDQSWAQMQMLGDRDVRAFTTVGNDTFVGTFDRGVFRSRDHGETWTPVNNGLTELRVTSLITSGTTIFAGTFGGGVFRLTDQGQNWTAVKEGLTDMIVRAIAVNGNNLFAGTDNGGVFHSNNQGLSWQPVMTGLTEKRVFALTVHRENLFAGTGNRVFRSINNGQSWTPVRSGMEQNTPVDSLLSDGANLYAGTFGGVFVTTNNGESWTPINKDLETRIFSLASNNMNLFAGTVGAGVFRSTNGGLSWEKASKNLTAMAIYSLAATGATTLAGTGGNGIYLSTDKGESWTAITSGVPPYAWISAFAIINNTIFAGTDGFGILRSTEQGRRWESVNTGLSNWGVLALAASDTTLFAGTYGGVFRSIDRGQNWTRISAGLPPDRGVISLAVNGQNLFAGTDGYGVYQSANQGNSWSPINNGLPENVAVPALTVRGTELFAGTDNGVFRSSDQGRNWIRINNTGLTNPDVRALVVNDQILYAGTSGNGVFRLSDDGQSWSGINTGLTNPYVTSFLINGTSIFIGTIGLGVFIGQ